MAGFEYKVVSAPQRGKKAKGVKQPQDRFALAMETVLNEMGRDGWEYLRADTLPCEERQGLRGKQTHYRNVLVFRRAVDEETEVLTPIILAAADKLGNPDKEDDAKSQSGDQTAASDPQATDSQKDQRDSEGVGVEDDPVEDVSDQEDDQEEKVPTFPTLGGFRRNARTND